jgi:FixJ family two-component response regulator
MNPNLLERERQATVARKVHVVDDDPMVLAAMARLLRMNDFDVVTHASARGFLAAYERDEPGCALVDVGMPAMDGLALQAALREREGPPLVFLSGLSDVPTCAEAMRNGAVDFLEKPVDELHLVRAVEDALQRDADARGRRTLQRELQALLQTLTQRETEVLVHVMECRLNKQIAFDLDIAEKTVKVHRARAMEKMGARSVAELVRMVERGGGMHGAGRAAGMLEQA